MLCPGLWPGHGPAPRGAGQPRHHELQRVAQSQEIPPLQLGECKLRVHVRFFRVSRRWQPTSRGCAERPASCSVNYLPHSCLRHSNMLRYDVVLARGGLVISDRFWGVTPPAKPPSPQHRCCRGWWVGFSISHPLFHTVALSQNVTRRRMRVFISVSERTHLRIVCR